MTQFLKFEKITTGTASQKSPILVNRSSILMVEEETFEDKVFRTNITASRVYIIGYPEYTFQTLTPMADIEAIIGTIDVTQGVQTGVSSCGGAPGVLDIVSLEGSLPSIKLKRIKNNVANLTQDYVCNPNYLLYAEETGFQDEITELPAVYLNLVFRGNPLRRIPTKLTFAELEQLLEPTIVP